MPTRRRITPSSRSTWHIRRSKRPSTPSLTQCWRRRTPPPPKARCPADNVGGGPTPATNESVQLLPVACGVRSPAARRNHGCATHLYPSLLLGTASAGRRVTWLGGEGLDQCLQAGCGDESPGLVGRFQQPQGALFLAPGGCGDDEQGQRYIAHRGPLAQVAHQATGRRVSM